MNSFEGNVTGGDDGTHVLCNVTSRLADALIMDLPKRRR